MVSPRRSRSSTPSPESDRGPDLLREVVSESPSGFGAALYVHDLDTGISTEH